jgi:uncharacterized protein YyaL (SSP411 family)
MNRLQQETSPYLLQHVNNPVHWYPWCEEAFEEARIRNIPVLVSIGYASCHWCHVMAHESFENEQVAEIMNQHFVNIKVDREELPDVDAVYMDAVQAMTGSGGWPLNVFLTADKQPFYGGTYFPPRRMHQRASWTEVLINVSQFYSQNRQEVMEQAAKLHEHLKNLSNPPTGVTSTTERDGQFFKEISRKIMLQADEVGGGFGQAPKFPSTMTLTYLLHDFIYHKNEEALQQVIVSLDAMMMGGIYDQLGGGFSRYSTDKYWVVPHFEKMLYDNALLLELYASTYRIKPDPRYLTIIEETLDWLAREMTHASGAFYSAQDADSEGKEGLYYTWTAAELKTLLGDDYGWFAELYHVEEEGNWEERNILYLTANSWESCSEETRSKLPQVKAKLQAVRSERKAPLTDDKVILGWNALMNKALLAVYAFTGNMQAKQLADHNLNFIREYLVNTSASAYYRIWRNGQRKISAYADDLAYVVELWLAWFRIEGDGIFVQDACAILEYLNTHYRKPENTFYQLSHQTAGLVEIHKTELYDGACPSLNAIIARQLISLFAATNDNRYKEQAMAMLQAMQEKVFSYPTSFSHWATTMHMLHQPWKEFRVVGKQAREAYLMFLKLQYEPHVHYLIGYQNIANVNAFSELHHDGDLQIYPCHANACLPPVTSVDKALSVI